MKTPLGTEVDLRASHIVLDEGERGTAVSPLFSPCLLWPRSPISAPAELVFNSFYVSAVVNTFSTVCNVQVIIACTDFVFCLFICGSNILERLNGFASNSQEDVFGPSLGWVWISRSQVNVTRDKTRCTHYPSPAATEWNALAANNVNQQQTGSFRRCRGWFRRPACGLYLVKHL